MAARCVLFRRRICMRSLTIKRRTTAFISPSIGIQRSASSADIATSDILIARLELLDDLHGLYLDTMLPLLVLVSGLLSQDHYAQLASTLWRCLTDATTEVASAVRHVATSADTALLTVT